MKKINNFHSIEENAEQSLKKSCQGYDNICYISYVCEKLLNFGIVDLTATDYQHLKFLELTGWIAPQFSSGKQVS